MDMDDEEEYEDYDYIENESIESYIDRGEYHEDNEEHCLAVEAEYEENGEGYPW